MAASGAPAAEELDPRIERSRRVVLAAALELLGEVGYGGLTVEATAARAGVAKSTIYRHWTGRIDLVEDAFRTLKAVIVPPAEGPVRDRVVGLLERVAAHLADSTESACLPAMIDAAAADPEVRELHRRVSAQRRQVLVDLLSEGVGSGELGPGADPELLADALAGPIFVRLLLLHEPFDPAAVPALVDQILPLARG